MIAGVCPFVGWFVCLFVGLLVNNVAPTFRHGFPSNLHTLSTYTYPRADYILAGLTGLIFDLLTKIGQKFSPMDSYYDPFRTRLYKNMTKIFPYGFLLPSIVIDQALCELLKKGFEIFFIFQRTSYVTEMRACTQCDNFFIIQRTLYVTEIQYLGVQYI